MQNNNNNIIIIIKIGRENVNQYTRRGIKTLAPRCAFIFQFHQTIVIIVFDYDYRRETYALGQTIDLYSIEILSCELLNFHRSQAH